ncbi:MAG: CpaE family protein [Actinomycetota bacterium]
MTTIDLAGPDVSLQGDAPVARLRHPGAFPDRYAVAVVEPDAGLRALLATQVPEAREFGSVDDLAAALPAGRPVVAVFGPGMANSPGFEQAHRLVTTCPEVGAVFVAHALTTELLQHALRSGARDAVEIDAAGDALAGAVVRVGEDLVRRPRGGAGQPVPQPGPGAHAAPGRLVAVFSTNGGVGKSTLATNVATAMARKVESPVALMDADLQFGDISVMLGLPPEHTVLDAAAVAASAEPELMRNLVTRADSGLMVLPAPNEPSLSTGIAPEDMTAVCGALQGISSFVVVDVPTSFDDTTLAVLDEADDVLLVATMDIPSIKNLKIGMQALDLMAIAGPKLRLVLNRATTQVKLDVREVEQVLGLRAAFPVPYDVAVPLSINAGIPVVVHDRKSAAARAFEHIAESLVAPAVATGATKRKSKKSSR